MKADLNVGLYDSVEADIQAIVEADLSTSAKATVDPP
jgi:hypothetical protein